MGEIEVTRSDIKIIFTSCPDPAVCFTLEIFYWLNKAIKIHEVIFYIILTKYFCSLIAYFNP